MNTAACTKKDFITVLREAKQQKRERERRLQREWAELQKRAYFDSEIAIFKENKPQ